MGRVLVYLKHCSKHRDEWVTLCIVDHHPTSGPEPNHGGSAYIKRELYFAQLDKH